MPRRLVSSAWLPHWGCASANAMQRRPSARTAKPAATAPPRAPGATSRRPAAAGPARVTFERRSQRAPQRAATPTTIAAEREREQRRLREAGMVRRAMMNAPRRSRGHPEQRGAAAAARAPSSASAPASSHAVNASRGWADVPPPSSSFERSSESSTFCRPCLSPRVGGAVVLAAGGARDVLSSSGLMGISISRHTFCRRDPAPGNGTLPPLPTRIV